MAKRNTWGGARIGAGARVSSRTLETQRMRELMLKQLEPRAKELFDSLIDSAVGLRAYRKIKGEMQSVYSKAPDVGAARLLLEHTIGKPKETVQHQGTLGIMTIIRSLEKDDVSYLSEE